MLPVKVSRSSRKRASTRMVVSPATLASEVVRTSVVALAGGNGRDAGEGA
jgi:hypothetical protein